MKTSTDLDRAGADACAVRAVDAERVADTRNRLIGTDEADALAETLKLLAEPKRLRILYALVEAGELCVCDLAATADVSETAVSQAMRLLRAAGIVRNRRDGRMIYYRLDDAHVRLLLDVCREHVAHVDDVAAHVDEGDDHVDGSDRR